MADKGIIEIDIKVGRKEFNTFERATNWITKRLAQSIDKSGVRVSKQMRGFLQRITTELAAKHGSAWSGIGRNESILHVRSGRGLRELQNASMVIGGSSLDTVTARISAGRLSIHETGGRIYPRRSKYLTVPLPAAMDSRGVPLRTRAREWENTFTYMSKAGNLLIMQRRLGGMVPLYVLKTSVYLPPRLGMTNAFFANMTWLDKRIISAIDESIEVNLQ